ncbi:hypothetical protein G9A89_001074 [Geosiphon pyriformis]|nr:hypothetical protein G9A89_001074 [Geosiphon pyriformis]
MSLVPRKSDIASGVNFKRAGLKPYWNGQVTPLRPSLPLCLRPTIHHSANLVVLLGDEISDERELSQRALEQAKSARRKSGQWEHATNDDAREKLSITRFTFNTVVRWNKRRCVVFNQNGITEMKWPKPMTFQQNVFTFGYWDQRKFYRAIVRLSMLLRGCLGSGTNITYETSNQALGARDKIIRRQCKAKTRMARVMGYFHWRGVSVVIPNEAYTTRTCAGVAT